MTWIFTIRLTFEQAQRYSHAVYQALSCVSIESTLSSQLISTGVHRLDFYSMDNHKELTTTQLHTISEVLKRHEIQ